MRDVTTLVSEEKVNLATVNTAENADGTATITLTVHISGLEQLGRIFAKLDGVRGVLSATRILNDGARTSRS